MHGSQLRLLHITFEAASGSTAHKHRERAHFLASNEEALPNRLQSAWALKKGTGEDKAFIFCVLLVEHNFACMLSDMVV